MSGGGDDLSFTPSVDISSPARPTGRQTGPRSSASGSTTEASWSPPQRLVDFLTAGAPPIYVGFGSMIGRRPEDFTRIVLDAVRLSGRRAIVALGWGGLRADTAASENILLVDRAPHSWLFRHVDLAVHHGGAGTTAAATRAGLAQVIIPFVADQPFWAWKAWQAGIAPAPIDQKTVTAASLAAAIRQAGEPALRARARALATEISDEDGVGNAIQALQNWGMLPPQPAATEAPGFAEALS